MSQQSPAANVQPGLLWLLASPFGRVAREPYWLALLLMWLVIGFTVNMWLNSLPNETLYQGVDIAQFFESNPLLPILYIALQGVELALVIKRCQDAGLSGFFALLLFVPLVNLVTVLWLGFLPSQKGPNSYGPLPNSYYRSPS